MAISFNSFPGEEYELRQEVYFDSYRYGTTSDLIEGQIKIQRATDGWFWNGTIFTATEMWLDTDFTPGNEYHSYTWIVPVDTNIIYNVRIRVNTDRTTETLMAIFTKPEPTSGGGGSGSSAPVFDAVDFVTGFPFR